LRWQDQTKGASQADKQELTVIVTASAGGFHKPGLRGESIIIGLAWIPGQQPGMMKFMVFFVESFVRVLFNSIEASNIDAFFSSRYHRRLDGL
jgi:hypothetical protein